MEPSYVLYRVENGVRFVLAYYETREEAEAACEECTLVWKDAVDKTVEVTFTVAEDVDA